MWKAPAILPTVLKLEDIVVGASVGGILANQTVTIRQVLSAAA